jgi:cation transport regulator ChaB
MARFDDVLSSDDAQEIHAFLLDRAWDGYTTQSTRRDPAPASN